MDVDLDAVLDADTDTDVVFKDPAQYTGFRKIYFLKLFLGWIMQR